MKKHHTKNENRKPVGAGSILKAIASFFIWGFGQLFNKQYLKALFFFIFFVGFIGVELGSSKYFQETSPYDRLPGEDLDNDPNYPNLFIQKTFWDWYREYKLTNYTSKNIDLPESFVEFEEKYYVDAKLTLTEQELIEYLALDLARNNPEKYTNILNSSEVFIGEDANNFLEKRENLVLSQTLYEGLGNEFYLAREITTDSGDKKTIYVEVDFLNGKTNEENYLETSRGLTSYQKTSEIYVFDGKAYLKVIIDGSATVYMNLFDLEAEKLLELPTKANLYKSVGPIYSVEGNLYEYWRPGLVYGGSRLQYKPTDFSKVFTYAMGRVFSSEIANPYDGEDYTRFVVKVYLAINTDEREKFESDFSNFFYEKAGLFLKGYWGVATLGTTHKMEFTQYMALENALAVNQQTGKKITNLQSTIPIMGHVSTHVLIESLIGVILSLFFGIFWIWSVIDAFKVSERKRNEEEVPENIQYFKETYENSFEYIVLSPALFVLAFISIMPIVFSFLLAFTSISGRQSMIETFEYVGIKNFIALFDFSGALGSSFGKAFWSVLSWTVIWAVFSTVTCFFGGFFQALILNSEKVVFRKFWRTILILPWAMPALLSQMVFSVMFGETGYINDLFRRLGMYNLFEKLGWLGNDISVLQGFEKRFYIGNTNIQWFTNPYNPTFVRIILVIVNIWLGFPYFMALMSGIMTSIDKSLYEAADIDGATGWQKIRKITMPLVLYSTAPILIMTFSGNFNNFGVIYFITGGGPNAGDYSRGFAGDTDILISWMYKLTVDEAIYNIASVFSVLIFIFVGSLTVWNLSRTRAFRED